jgi:hypothetical protein
MITLAENCLLFRLANGESVPFSPDMLSVEIMGEAAQTLDDEFVIHAAKAVFHYFRQELGRQSVTVGEFAGALEKVLRGFNPESRDSHQSGGDLKGSWSDLCRLAQESGKGCELFFFPRLRDDLREQLGRNPGLVRFRGLRSCVKQLVGAQRWTPRCQSLEEQIVDFLRECLTAEVGTAPSTMLVE